MYIKLHDDVDDDEATKNLSKQWSLLKENMFIGQLITTMSK